MATAVRLKLKLYFVGLLSLTVLLTTPIPALAQIEEVVVTARKRAESLQDVPISVQTFEGEYIEQQGLFDIGSLAPYTPNFQYSQAPGASDLLIMRGLGTYGSGVHFEPSIGQVFNGYFSTRSRMSRTALIDVAQVEVLKGPQGAIIGKNTSLGAINITSNKPTDEFEAKLAAQYNIGSSGGYEVQGIVSGPLTDRIRGRLVVDRRDIDGWVDNRWTGEKDSAEAREDLTVRVMLDVDITDNFIGEFLYQYNDLDRYGGTREVTHCFVPAANAAQGFDCKLNASNQNGNIRQGVDLGEHYTTDANIVGATFTWDLGDYEVKSLTNYTEYEIGNNFSGDLLATERASIDNFEDYEQVYQELRINSTWDKDWYFTLGFSYLWSDMLFLNNFEWAIPFNFNRHEEANADTDSWALFGQVDWDITEQFTLTFGGRYTDESRDGSKLQLTRELYTNVPRPDWCNNLMSTGGVGVPVPGPRTCTFGNDFIAGPANFGTVPLPGVTGPPPIGGTPVTGERDESKFSYNASIQWKPTDDHMGYFTLATGVKSGGFDLRGAGDPRVFVFGDEKTTNIEVGGKHSLLDNTLRFNWTFFHTEVDDLQVSTNDPILIQQVVGRANVTNFGVEVDSLLAISGAFNLSMTAAWLDSEIEDFTSGCYPTQTAADGCVGGFFVQDGLRLPFTPDWQVVLGGNYTWRLDNGMELILAGKWSFIDDMHNTLRRDPFAFHDASHRFDASLTLERMYGDNLWSLAVVGRNLTNEKVFMWCNTSGLAGPLHGSCATEELRYIAIRATVSWGQ